MVYLTNDNKDQYINTGNELTAQNLTGNLEELYIGNDDVAYINAEDAAEFFEGVEDTQAMYQPGRNALYVHLTKEELSYLLSFCVFVITDDEE